MGRYSSSRDTLEDDLDLDRRVSQIERVLGRGLSKVETEAEAGERKAER